MSENTNKDATVEEATQARGYRKTPRGYVVSDKMDKTIVVEVEDRVKHALYGKVIRRNKKRKAHDEQNSPASATWCSSPRPGRCPPPSGGAWSRSSKRPSRT